MLGRIVTIAIDLVLLWALVAVLGAVPFIPAWVARVASILACAVTIVWLIQLVFGMARSWSPCERWRGKP